MSGVFKVQLSFNLLTRATMSMVRKRTGAPSFISWPLPVLYVVVRVVPSDRSLALRFTKLGMTTVHQVRGSRRQHEYLISRYRLFSKRDNDTSAWTV